MDENNNNNILEFKPKIKSANNLNNENATTEDKVRKEIISPTKLVEFVLKGNDNDVWISIESLSNNKLVNDSLAKAMQDERIRELCNKTCSTIDSIIDIKKNKTIIMNMMKSLNSNERILSLISLTVQQCKEYDEFDNNINTYLEILILIEDGICYFEKNNELGKLIEYIKENKDELVELGGTFYYTIEDTYDKCVKINDFN